MARNSRSPVTGKHRVARRTKIAMGAIGLAIAVGGLAVAVTAGRTGEASADPADPSFFIDINKVPAGNNVNAALQKKGAQGSFTVDCGTNADGAHHNPDNFIAQPGIKNGAQHLHDYVGNVTTDADSSLKSLLAGDTTCKNGDQSAYFWPVIRIDREDNAANQSENQKAQQDQQGKTGDVQQDQSAKDAQAADAAGQGQDQAAQDQNAQDQGAQDQNAQDQQDPNAQDQNGQDQNGQQKRRNTGGGATRNGDQSAQQQGDQGQQDQQQAQDRRRGGQNGGQNNGGKNNGGQNGGQNNGGQNGNQSSSAAAPPAEELGGPEGANEEVGDNDGEILEPESATLKFIGGGAKNVVAMPLGLKILYGDAKQSTNGPANARPSWTCTGFEDRLTDLYPICPAGSKVERIHAFPNCWDGKNTDSANHRTHIVFANQQGKCPQGFKNVPQLQVTLVYDVPQDVQQKGQYKVDAFAQEKHNPRSDHDDFANVMNRKIMGRLVNCINSGKACAE
ncbi:hypothetical protein Amsp01_083530 [Amycolatopsis sp. NBRC 101858]|uniref:DUF1996 domain-containing protein n=1 Tax=Amycolatopsis sp. NBRC 101858 TaxID=3032200 RepID=UPI00249FFFFE|nr:DUF1996 domain-containing protein [Amycolatopsis sp. NBRC 101858]GLY42330.1 hypothetical protein Amsp01_083530 [Amycolatopsis sp. NBRC 101858]